MKNQISGNSGFGGDLKANNNGLSSIINDCD